MPFRLICDVCLLRCAFLSSASGNIENYDDLVVQQQHRDVCRLFREEHQVHTLPGLDTGICSWASGNEILE